MTLEIRLSHDIAGLLTLILLTLFCPENVACLLHLLHIPKCTPESCADPGIFVGEGGGGGGGGSR